MANADSRFGLKPIGHPSGLSKARMTAYYVPPSDSTALFVGDPVVRTGDSNAAEYSAPGLGTAPVGALANVTRATAGAGNAITGVIVAIAANPDNLSQKHRPASTAAVVYVNDDPQTEYEIQCAGAVTTGSVGNNAQVEFTHGGSTQTGLSGAEATAAVSTAANGQLRILGVVPRTDNEVGANAKLRVRINNHSEASATAGV